MNYYLSSTCLLRFYRPVFRYELHDFDPVPDKVLYSLIIDLVVLDDSVLVYGEHSCVKSSWSEGKGSP